MQRNSPSNVETGWRKKYFHKIDDDGMLDNFIEIFTKNGNSWSMTKEVFDKIIAKGRINDYPSFKPVYDQVLEINGNTIGFKEDVAEDLLSHNWQWSFRNALKNLGRSAFVEMFIDFWAFIVDPDAREVSDFKYPNGNAMSVRCAKKLGLKKTINLFFLNRDYYNCVVTTKDQIDRTYDRKITVELQRGGNWREGSIVGAKGCAKISKKVLSKITSKDFFFIDCREWEYGNPKEAYLALEKRFADGGEYYSEDLSATLNDSSHNKFLFPK